MAYLRVSILGTAQGGEVWSINPTFDPEGELPGFPSQGPLDAAALAIANLNPGANLLAILSPALSITGARVEARDDTTDDLIAISNQSRTTPLPGTGTVRMPPQSAQVFSLRTNTPGGSGRGRIYWPIIGQTLGSDLRIGSSSVTTNLTEMKTYLAAIESALEAAWPGSVFQLAVRSRATRSTPHVVRLQAGNVVDTQRRRRDTLAEVYSTVNYP